MPSQTAELPAKQVAGQVLGRADDGDQGDRSEAAPGAGKRAWWKDRDILVACGSYGMLALVFIILGEALRLKPKPKLQTNETFA